MSVSCLRCVLPATGRSLVQRSPTDCDVSLNPIQCKNNPLHVPWRYVENVQLKG